MQQNKLSLSVQYPDPRVQEILTRPLLRRWVKAALLAPAQITLRFVGELTSAVRDKAGQVVEGSTTEIKRQRDSWTFARTMGGQDPNWQLVATGE